MNTSLGTHFVFLYLQVQTEVPGSPVFVMKLAKKYVFPATKCMYSCSYYNSRVLDCKTVSFFSKIRFAKCQCKKFSRKVHGPHVHVCSVAVFPMFMKAEWHCFNTQLNKNQGLLTMILRSLTCLIVYPSLRYSYRWYSQLSS